MLSASTVFARAAESQRNFNTGTGTVTAWWRVAVAAHHLLIAGVTFTGGSGTTITPPAGWLPIGTTYRSDNGTTIGMAIYYIPDCPAKVLHTTETFTFTPSTTVATVQLTEVAGVLTTDAVDTDTIATKTGTGTSIALSASSAVDETSQYGYALVASTAQTTTFGTGTNGFARTSSYLYNTSTQVTNLDAGTSHRTTMESTLMTSAAGATLSTTISTANAPFTGMMVGFRVQALYWIGAGSYPARPVNPSPPVTGVCYGYFDDDACWSNASGGAWSGTNSPGANDVVVFDAGGLGDCTMNPWSPGTELAYSIEVRSGYIGAITKAAYDLQLQRHFTLAAGTFNGSAGLNFQTNQTTAYVGDLDVSGGTLNGNGMNFYVRALYVEAGTLDVGTGTFSTNNGAGGIVNIGGGTARFGGALSTTAALTMLGGNLIGGVGGIAIGGAGTLTSASLTAGAGAFSLAGALTLNTSSTCNLSAASSRIFPSNASVLTSSTLTLGPGTSTIPGSVTVRGAGSTFNAGTTALTIGANVTVDQSGTFNATGGTIAITGTLTARGAGVSFSAGATTMTVGNTVVVDQAATFNANSATIDYAGTFTLGSSGGALSTLNASTSTLSFNNVAGSGVNSFLIYSPSVLNGGTAHLNFGVNTASTARSFRMTGGVADMSTATVTFNGAGLFFPDGGTVTFGSGSVTMPGAMMMQGAAVNLGSIALTVSGPTTLTTGSLSTGTGSATFNGTFAANGGTMTGGSAPLTFNGATTFSGVTYTAGTGALIFSSSYAITTGTANLTSASALTFGTSFSVSSGTTTFGSQVVGLPNLTVTGGVFNAGTSTVTVAGTTTSSSGTTNFGSSAAGPTFMGGVSISGGAVTLGPGTAVMQSTLGTSGGTLTGGSGPLTIQGAVTMLGGVISLGGGTIGLQSTLTFTGNGTFNAGGSTLTIAGAISMVNGTFNGNTSTIVAQGAATFAGTLPSINSTFNANASNTKFQGPVAVGGSDGSRGSFHAMAATLSFEFPTTGMSPNSVLLQGSTLTLFDVATFSPYATITFGKNTIAGTNAINLSAGTMTLNSSVTTTFVDLGEVTIGTGTTLAVGANAVTFPNTVNLLGTFLGNTGGLTFSRALTVTGTLTGGSGTMTFSQPVSVTGTFSGSTGLRNFSSTLAVTGTYLSSSGAHTFGAAVTNNAGTLNLSTGSSPLTVGFGLSIGGGTTTIGTQTTSISALTLTSGAFGVGNATMTVVGDTNVTGGVATLSNTSNTVTFSGNLNVGPGTLTAGGAVTTNSRPVTVTGATTVISNGIINAGASSNFRFTGPVTLGTVAAGSTGTFNGDTSTTVFSSGATVQGGSTLNVGTLATFNAFQLLGSSAFNGGAGSSTFGLPPTLTSGTFSVGTTATTGRHTFQQNATFSNGVTLSFPSSGGRLSLSALRVLTLQGPVTAATTTGATLPKIDCNGCTSTQGVTVAFASTSTLNIDGLEFNHSVSTGVSIASGATYTLLKRLKFQTNAANGGVGSTHLVITLGAATINVPGSFFDTTAATNVTLNGTAGQVRGARAIFEVQSTATNGTGAGEARDVDGDNAPGDASPANNLGENVAAPYYGSVVQWSTASPTDTAGTAEGFPTAAFDWNTYAAYGVYAGYRNIGGAGTADRIWLRNADGTAAYHFDVPDSSGDVLGSPYWATSNEITMGLDVNGDGDQTDTSVHVVYVPTTGGHIIKLIDSGTALARPASGVWTSDFTDANVASISSPLISDAANLYFGGANTTATRIFGVQIEAGGSEKTLVKDIVSVGAVTAAMSWKRISGIVYLYVGSRATLGQAYIYRINVSPGAVVEASYAGVTSSVNGSVRLANNRAYAVTDGGQVHALDATNFATNAFVNVAGFPYQTTVARPIQLPATIYPNGYAYFGDDSGRLYALTSAGADQTGYPFVVTAAAITSSPLYVPSTGVIALGAADGYIYFIDRHNATGVPALFNRYYVGTGSVSSVSYNASNSQFMVSSSDGKLAFIASTSVPDPTSSNE